MNGLFYFEHNRKNEIRRMKYIYDTVSISYSIWTGRSKVDYLDIINEKGHDGWKFISFTPNYARPKGAKGIELIFEKQVSNEI